MTTSSYAEEEWTLDKILERYYRVRGGPEATQGIQSLRMTGKLEVPNGRQDIVLIKKKPHYSRTTLKVGKRRKVTAYDGNHVWEMIDGQDIPRSIRVLPETEGYHFAQEAKLGLFGPLFGYKTKRIKIEFLGLKTINPLAEIEQTQSSLSQLDESLHGDIECFHLRGLLPNGSTMEFFLQKDTFWEIKITSHLKNAGSDEGETRHYYFSDYRTVGPLKEAFQIQIFNDSGQYLSTLLIGELTFNVGVYTRYFQQLNRE